MQKVLIICNHFGSSSSANGICARNIARELQSNGYDISIITGLGSSQSVEDTRDFNSVIIEDSPVSLFLNRLESNSSVIIKSVFRILNTVRGILVSWWFPNVFPLRAMKYQKACTSLIREIKIDTVIAFYRPYESIACAMKMKQKFENEVKVITYHLDLLSEPNNKSNIVKNYKVRKGMKAFQRELAICDAIILPENAKERYEKISNKLYFSDFPLYIKNDCGGQDRFSFGKDTINISYLGSLDKNNRSPKDIIRMIELLPKIDGKNVFLHIWGRISDSETKDIINNSKHTEYHGFVNSDHVPAILDSSDFVLNISNSITYKMLPSKIFQLFAANRPIINIVYNEDDVTLPYFNKSNGVLRINAYENAYPLENLKTFIQEWRNRRVNNTDDLFIKSTPQYIVSLIENIVS